MSFQQEEDELREEFYEKAEDKVGTFQDGYRCMRDQVINLIRGD